MYSVRRSYGGGIELVSENDEEKLFFKHKLVGKIVGDTFFKFVKTENIYRKWNSIGIELKILNFLKLWGIEKIVVEIDDGRKFEAFLYQFFFSNLETVWKGEVQKHLELERMSRVS